MAFLVFYSVCAAKKAHSRLKAIYLALIKLNSHADFLYTHPLYFYDFLDILWQNFP